ncbi:MAG: hypothetical protein DRJ62_06365 [Thermoprotei archaeon]|nr:MAG: hypothetical protein DRJ62_06365 [Thermoprotei archaeon]
MKIFTIWYPNPPDPPYWKWIKLNEITIPLAKASNKFISKAIAHGIHELLEFNGTIMADSLTSNNRIGQVHMLFLQSYMGVDIAVHRDYPFINLYPMEPDKRWALLKKNILNAEIALRLEEELGIRVLYVIQGWDEESYKYCAERYLEMSIQYMGIGSLKYRDPRSIIKIVKFLKELVGKRTYLHVFGVLKPSILKALSKYVDSVDTSSPIQAAIRKEIFVLKDGILKRLRVNYLSTEDILELIPGNLKSILEDAFKDEDLGTILSKSKYARSIINTAVLLSFLKDT